MSDEQRVRSALEYDLDPWQPDPADLMRRGRRFAWIRRGLAAVGVAGLAGTVATVSAAVGGPTEVRNLLAGGGKPSVPVALPTGTPTPIPSVDRTCRPQVPTVTAEVSASVKVPAELPKGKPSLPTANPTAAPLPGKPTRLPVPTAKPSVPTAKPPVPPCVTEHVPTLPPATVPTTKPSAPGKPSVPKPTLPGKPTLPPLPTAKPTLPGKPTLPPLPTAKPTLPTALPSLPSLPTQRPTVLPTHR
ncbi:hypothetical protein Kfla_0340 [Kribbella flavida DSM 17836]|uniref:Uncharacterized protein n=1 Tax=Kribbella flavida (strain DSM 17836 / JCM 10339 / NBRC 14399) TaxID=479435 RepID=D2PTE8_KRIFD|nr:hypothetical protein [Kribbella flavida]ADB29464.1 hypothetical protein Kfla_0340 [Kribbella flavida DSM 17836]